MAVPAARRIWVVLGATAALAVAAAIAGYLLWPRPAPLPGPGSQQYEDYVEASQVGVAALDVDVPDVAETYLTRATELIPEEPSSWANRGLLYLRHNRLDEAARDLQRANRLAPANGDILKMLGLLEQRQGKFAEAAAHFRQAVASSPHDVEALYQLAKVIDQEQQEGSDAEYQRLMEQILAVQPSNLHVLLDRLKKAVARSDREAIQDTIARLKALSPEWSERGRAALADLERDLAGQLGPDAVSRTLVLANLLRPEPAYARGLTAVDPPNLPGTSIQTFIVLAPVPRTPSPPDMELAFAGEPVPGAPPGRWDTILPLWLTGEGQPVLFVANAKELRQAGSDAGLAGLTVGTNGLLTLDWNNDFRSDLLLAGQDGLRFYQQREDGSFADVTAATGLPADILKGDYFGAWAQDVDFDGDLDIILARREGPPLLLRNNLDGTFTPLPIFPGVTDVRAFAWVDLDNDGSPDVALLDARGRLHVFANERGGRVVPWPVAPPDGRFLALCVMDADDDGLLDLLALRDDGAVLRLSDRDKRKAWDAGEVVRWDRAGGKTEPGAARLIAADFDNNGAIDLLASGPEGSRIWLGEGGGKFQKLTADLPPNLVAAADLDGKGRLDLLGLDGEGRPRRLRNTGRKDYHWQAFRFRARPRDLQQQETEVMNSFAIGSDVEVRAITCFAKQPITTPVVHFGLGTRSRPSVIRARWTTGRVQTEWEQPVDQTVLATQRGFVSCPFLFTWDGRRFVFVTDFMWSSPLGVPGGEQGQDNFTLQTADWVRIRGDQLVPREDAYEVRVLANLWETHFYDRLALLVVDHPADTELFVDERASLAPAELAFHLVESPRPVARAWDHKGADVTSIVAARDGVYLDRAGRGPFRGIANDHWVEIDLGDDVPRDGPVWLVAQGWVKPVDSTTYVAIAQGRHEQPREPVLEVPDGRGGWKVARDNIGYPAGKDKTILIRLDGIDGSGVPRRFRLRTNMEIYWDAFGIARGRDGAPRRQQLLSPQYADLHFRGVLDMSRASPSAPELPQYDRVLTVGQPWRNLIGYHTRYGNVRDLIEKSDDRYAILTAGDEMTLRFAVPPGPPPGWKRDFVWQCDGWTKDGDLNTRFGKTVLPLPAHDLKTYYTPPGRLEDDPVFRRHAADWQVYHTRYVTPYLFERGLRTACPDPARRQP